MMKIRGCKICGPRDCICPLPVNAIENTVSSPPLTVISPLEAWRRTMQRTWFVIAHKHDGDCIVSTEFRSPIAAQEYALDEVNKAPDQYHKVVIAETMSVCINTRSNEPSTFVHTGPEYVHRNQ